MSASDETKSDATKKPAEEAEAPSGPTIEHEAPEPAQSPFARKLKLYGILAAIVLAALVAAAGSYPYWRAKAAPVVARVGLDLETIEQRLRIPRWAITHGREAQKPDAEAAPKAEPQPAPQAAPTPLKSEETPATPDDAVRRAELEALADLLSTLGSRISDIEGRVSALESRDAQAGSRDSGGGASDPTGSISAIAEKLDALTGRLDELEAGKQTTGTAQTVPAAAPESGALIGTVVALAERVAAMEARGSAGASEVEALRENTQTLASRLGGLDKEVKQVGAALAKETPERDRAALLLLSVGQLAVAASGADGFEAELEAVRAVAGEGSDLAEPLDRLAQVAKTGALTIVALRNAFAEASDAVVRSRDVGSAKGFVGQTLSRVASLVTIRKVDDPGSATVDGALAAADAALAAGDLATAVAAMRKLDGAPGEAIAEWLGRAQARVTVDEAISDLQAAAIRTLAAAG
jgi:hypothetical protein